MNAAGGMTPLCGTKTNYYEQRVESFKNHRTKNVDNVDVNCGVYHISKEKTIPTVVHSVTMGGHTSFKSRNHAVSLIEARFINGLLLRRHDTAFYEGLFNQSIIVKHHACNRNRQCSHLTQGQRISMNQQRWID